MWGKSQNIIFSSKRCPSNTHFIDQPFSTRFYYHLSKSGDCIYVALFLDSLFCSMGLFLSVLTLTPHSLFLFFNYLIFIFFWKLVMRRQNLHIHICIWLIKRKVFKKCTRNKGCQAQMAITLRTKQTNLLQWNSTCSGGKDCQIHRILRAGKVKN